MGRLIRHKMQKSLNIPQCLGAMRKINKANEFMRARVSCMLNINLDLHGALVVYFNLTVTFIDFMA